MAPRLKPERGACIACGKIAVLAKYWGGTVCAACAVFFHRSIQKSLVYRCLADKELCGVTSVKDFTAHGACKTCRLNRCFQAGMQASEISRTDTFQQMQISDDHRFPILAAMITAVRNADHYFTSTLVPGVVLGTSELGDNYLTSPKTVDTLKAKNISYKMIIDFAPILTGLNLGIKNVVFDNCGILFNAIFCAHTDMMVNKTEPNRFYRSPNMYHDLDHIKLLYHVASFAPIGVARHSDELLSLSRELLCHFLYMRYTVQPLSAEVLKSEQDLAALLIIAVLFANGSVTQNRAYSEIANLNSVWKELSLHYENTHRDPSTLGNLFMLFSAITTAAHDAGSVMGKINRFYRGALLQRLHD